MTSYETHLSIENKCKNVFSSLRLLRPFIHSLNHAYHATQQRYCQNVYGSKGSCDKRSLMFSLPSQLVYQHDKFKKLILFMKH